MRCIELEETEEQKPAGAECFLLGLWGYGGVQWVNTQVPLAVINLHRNGGPPTEQHHHWITVTGPGLGGLGGGGGMVGAVLANLAV